MIEQKLPPIRLFGVVNGAAIEAAMLDVARSGMIASGAYVEKFRAALGEYVGEPQLVTTSDVSVAMRLALYLSGVQAGDEVIASPFTCLSTTSPIAVCGAKAVWADVDRETGILDVDDVKRLIGPKTKAVILYHLAGYPGPADKVAALCAEAGIKLIEDCDNALGATYQGRPVGSWGDYAVYSFYPNRYLHTLEGGAISCKLASDFERSLKLRWFGIDASHFRDHLGEINPDEDVSEIGWALRMSNISSAVGLAQLPQLDARLARVRHNIKHLSAALRNVPGTRVVPPLHGADPVCWGLLIHVPHRDEVLAMLKTGGIEVSKVHLRNDVYSGFNVEKRDLPGMSNFSMTHLFVPCGWWLDDAAIDRIARELHVAVAAVDATSSP